MGRNDGAGTEDDQAAGGTVRQSTAGIISLIDGAILVPVSLLMNSSGALAIALLAITVGVVLLVTAED